jgi:hypothetical protein
LCGLAHRRDLLLENAALRQQLAVYQRKGNRPQLTSADRLFWVWLSRCWPRWRSALFIVQPEAMMPPATDTPRATGLLTAIVLGQTYELGDVLSRAVALRFPIQVMLGYVPPGPSPHDREFST